MSVHIKITDKAPPRPEETERIKKEIQETLRRESTEKASKVQ